MNTQEIGFLLGASSITLLLFQSTTYKLLRKYLNIVELTRAMSLAGMVILMLIPLCTLARDDKDLRFGVLGISCFIWWMISFINMTNMSVMLNNCVLNSERGKINGLLITGNSGAKAIAPLTLGSLFASTASSGWQYPFNYALSFIIMSTVCLISFFVSMSSHLNKLHVPLEDRFATKNALVNSNNN